MDSSPEEHCSLGSNPYVWFSMPADKGLAVCAAVVEISVKCKSMPVKCFGKLLTRCLGRYKTTVRPGKVPETRRESARGQGCRKGSVLDPGGPNCIHAQHLGGPNTMVCGSNPPPRYRTFVLFLTCISG